MHGPPRWRPIWEGCAFLMFFTVLLLAWPFRRGAATSQLQSSEDAPLYFYVYKDPGWTCTVPLARAPPPSSGVHYYLAAQELWNRELMFHPWRVIDPERAQLFIVIFDMERSWYAGEFNGYTHIQRVENLLDKLQVSPWFLRNIGADHMWVIMRWEMNDKRAHQAFFPRLRRQLLANMIVGRYWVSPDPRTSYSLFTKNMPIKSPWRCVVTLPIVTQPTLWVEESYKQWEARNFTFFFRGKGRACHKERAQLNRDLALRLEGSVPPSILSNKHAATPEAYKAQITNSRFCLVFACDDPQTSRFYDAVAAGCIPVLVNDHFRMTVAPFSRLLNYDAFTITVSELDWQSDVVAAAALVYDWDKRALRPLHANLMAMRSAIMWHHPRPRIADYALRTVASECLPVPPAGELAPAVIMPTAAGAGAAAAAMTAVAGPARGTTEFVGAGPADAAPTVQGPRPLQQPEVQPPELQVVPGDPLGLQPAG